MMEAYKRHAELGLDHSHSKARISARETLETQRDDTTAAADVSLFPIPRACIFKVRPDIQRSFLLEAPMLVPDLACSRCARALGRSSILIASAQQHETESL